MFRFNLMAVSGNLLFFVVVLPHAAYNSIEHVCEGGINMCHIRLRQLLGLCAVCFAAGILCSFVFPLYFLAFLEAAVLIAAGVLLLRKHN